MRTCVCILTISPSRVWLEFLNKFVIYDIYMVCDSNSEDFSKKWNLEFPNIKFIQISNFEADFFGFRNSSSAISPQQIVNAWDKAIYYFSEINTTYDNVWLIEDDVYFHSEKTLLDIDNKYTESDLLTNTITPKSDDMKSSWHWHWCLFSIELPEPHYRAMVCATRVSRKLFTHINDYVNKNKTLFFLETMFPTIAMHHQLKYDVPNEFKYIEYRHEWLSEHINTSNLYHPMKNLLIHTDNRNIERYTV